MPCSQDNSTRFLAGRSDQETNPNPRSLRNFPMQANGAEMLRLACIMGVEAGIEICAPVHDAILVEAPIETIEEQARIMQGLMAKASAIVLGGFELRSDAKIVRSPGRYMDPRGKAMWAKVNELLERETAKSQAGHTADQETAHHGAP